MEHVQRPLLDTDLSIKQVAAASGFGGAVQLNHFFTGGLASLRVK